MINMETVVFINMLNYLAEKTRHGFVPFSECNDYDTFESILVYDDQCLVTTDGGLETNSSGKKGNHPVVLSACLAADHHGVMSYYDTCGDYCVEVMFNNCGENDLVDELTPYVLIIVDGSDDEIVIENGVWRIY